MTFDEALKEVSELSKKGAETWYGDQLEKRTNVKGHLESGDVEVIINKLRKEYVPTVEMTKGQYEILVMSRCNAVDRVDKVGLLEFMSAYSLLNQEIDHLRLMQAWLHPETIKVMEEKNNG